MKQKSKTHVDFEKFLSQASKTRILTNYHVISADLDTPVSVYFKLKSKSKDAFIFESVIGGEKIGRYSFVGYKAIEILALNPDAKQDCYKILEDKLIELNMGLEIKGDDLLPFFYKGFVGFFTFESVAKIETSLNLKEAQGKNKIPEMYQLLVGSLVVFDHVTQKIYLIHNSLAPEKFSKTDIEKLYEESCSNLNDLQALIEAENQERRLDFDFANKKPVDIDQIKSNTGKEDFENMVLKGKNHVYEGDVFQVVLSHKFYLEKNLDALNAYRLLRTINPSPYLFLFNFEFANKEYSVIGSSPEMLCKSSRKDSINIEAEIRPIAGTYRRGASLEEDVTLSEKLINDPKERAEHVMLIDLARNDLGRVCKQGSISVPQNMIVEKYSHVLHIVSSVKGIIKKSFGITAGIELLKACFPAGTLSGAPKVEALKIINKLEKEPRGIYGGTIGYFGLDGTIDTAIMIRTMLVEKDKVTIQAGAGVVADSDPGSEWQETINKASALLSVSS